MEERTRLRTLGAALLLAVLALWLASCTGESEDGGGMGEGGTAVSVSLTIRTRADNTGTSQSEYYVPGSEYENYIDVAGGDYRIYFFTYDPDDETNEETNNKYIATFTPESFVTTDKDGEYTTYEVMGTVPSDSELLECENFKVVMLANWGSGKENYNYDDDSMEPGVTTIDDVCSAEWSQYEHKTDFTLGSTNLIPFYGVQEYSGITFEGGKHTSLGELSLLRAMAKVEIVLAYDKDVESELTSVKIYRYNKTGYCAPASVYTQKDYYNGSWVGNEYKYNESTWESDFTKYFHLVNDGKNDDDSRNYDPLEFKNVVTHDNASADNPETWVAYVPEYDNSGEDYSYIEVTFEYDGTEIATPTKIYFADYDEDGEADLTNRYDIMRNCLYRFNVSIVKSYLQVKPKQWYYEWDNEFEFGSTSTTE